MREAFEAYAGALAASGDPAVAAALDKFNSLSRWKRAEGMLLDEKNGLLDQLVGQHEVELVALGATGETLWTHTDTQRLPRLPIEATSPVTNLTEGVRSRLERTGTTAETNPDDQKEDESESPAQRSAVVLISDGQHNEGPSPTEMARLLRTRRVPVYTVTLGSEHPPHDMAILDINHPDIVFHEDRVRGTIDLKDHMPARKPFTIKIEHEGELLWSKKLVTQGRSPRQVPFDFPIKELVDAKMAAVSDRDIKLHSMPLAFKVSVVPLEGEAREDNNTRPMHVRATTREGQLLILDGRSRWETRYVRNLFERDQRWKVNTLILPPGVAPKTGQAQGTFPQDREALFAYDLIIFGEVHPKTLTPEQSEWIRDFVKTRGGGLIFIDGQRQALRGYEGTPIADLLPVKWVERDDTKQPESLHLTDTGANVTALSLVSGQEPNTALWRTLPAPHWTAPVIALPGTETLAEATAESKTVPLLVQRRFGAGRVWYQGFDESWRWRFEIADRFHQRYWNQAAAWVMETPYAVSDQFASIDAGATVYRPGQNAPLRIRLKDAEGRPILHATAEAILYRDGREVAAIGLEADPNAGGVFRGTTPPLAGGRHEVGVRVTGIADDLIKARATFDVEAEDSAELSLLSADPVLLRRIAETSGGQALSEDRADQLPKLLEPLSGGRVVESETALWQSYWWFVPIVTLFTVEWVLRKRSGML